MSDDNGTPPEKPGLIAAPTADYAARVITLPCRHPILTEPLMVQISFATVKRWASAILDAEAKTEFAGQEAAKAQTGPRIVRP